MSPLEVLRRFRQELKAAGEIYDARVVQRCIDRIRREESPPAGGGGKDRQDDGNSSSHEPTPGGSIHAPE